MKSVEFKAKLVISVILVYYGPITLSLPVQNYLPWEAKGQIG
jgi:hypothetical protein